MRCDAMRQARGWVWSRSGNSEGVESKVAPLVVTAGGAGAGAVGGPSVWAVARHH